MSGHLSIRFGFVWAFRSDGASAQILIDVVYLVKFTDEVTFSPTFRPGFFAISFIVFWIWWRARSFSKGDKFIVRSVSDTLFLINNYVRRLSVLSTTAVQRDGLVVALGVHVVVVRTRKTPANDKTTPGRLLKTR